MLKTILEIVYPPKCIWCRKILQPMDGTYCCHLCEDKLEEVRQGLLKEEQTLKVIEVLGEEENLQLNPCLALVPYSLEYRQAILRWKYSGIRKYAKAFASLIVERKILERLQIDMLVPVPLAPSRMKKRGFNQALDLAEEMGKLTEIPVWNCLKRTRDTKPQAECSKRERSENIKDSITFNEQFEESKQYKKQKRIETVNCIAIIDDIYTTGSTARECMKVLEKQFLFRDATFYIIVVGKGSF